jgi:hypothetical protein
MSRRRIYICPFFSLMHISMHPYIMATIIMSIFIVGLKVFISATATITYYTYMKKIHSLFDAEKKLTPFIDV